MIDSGSIVVVHLQAPTEKFWGVLTRLDALGVVLRGIHLSSIEDWIVQVARDEPPSLDLSTLFVPMARVEKIYLDEASGEVPSYRQRFRNHVGVTVESYLGLGPRADSMPS